MRRWLIPLLIGITLTLSNSPFATADSSHVMIMPAWDDVTGNLIYLKSPTNPVLFPSHVNAHALAPLYAVVYPLGSTVETQCPGATCGGLGTLPPSLVFSPAVYPGGALRGHDRLVAPHGSGGDFNVAWEVFVVVFTPQAAADGATNVTITTLAQLNAAIAAGDATAPQDLGFQFHCSIAPNATQ
jgi:hypothetical protein